MAGQTSYSLYPAQALCGMQDAQAGDFTVSYVCSEDIPFGRFVELHTDGMVRLPKTASAIGVIVGVALYDAAKTPASGGGWVAGEVVPVLRRGRVWCEYTGTSPGSLLGAVNIRSASDDTNSEAASRGKVTATAASTTAGQEKYLLAGAKSVSADVTLTPDMALIELNLP